MNYKKIPILHAMVTTFFFDLFGVLLGADKTVLINYIANKTGNSYNITINIFNLYFTEFEKNKITFAQFFQKIQYKLKNGENLNIEEFKSTWMNQELKELPAVDYLKILKEKYSINLISNISDSYLNHLSIKFDFFDFFDHIITSEQAKSKKPSCKIFNYSIKISGANPSSSIFIDDQLNNVKSANKLGIKSHHYTSFHLFKTFLNDYV